MTIPEIVSVVKDMLIAGAATTTAVVAIVGLSNWNRELRGRVTFDTARSLAKSTYQLRDEIKECRSPFLAAAEFPDGYEGSLGRTSAREEALALAHVYGERWKFVWAALKEFDTNTLEAEVLWGERIRTKTDALRTCVRDLRTGIDALIQNAAVAGENFISDRNFEKEMRELVSSSSGDNNPLTVSMAKAIKEIELEVRQHLARSKPRAQ